MLNYVRVMGFAVGMWICFAAAGAKQYGDSVAEAGSVQNVKAELQARIRIPTSLLSVGVKHDPKGTKPDEVYRFGGDIRIGDLDSDGTVDFVLAQSVGGFKNCYIAAFTWDGRILWEWGHPRRQVGVAGQPGKFHRVQVPVRPGPLLVVDVDGDGKTEVVSMVIGEEVTETDVWNMDGVDLIVLDGRSGREKRRARPEILSRSNAYDEAGKLHPPNYVHLRLLGADLRGTGGPHDFVSKIGNTVLACNDRLELLWTYKNRFAKYGEHSSYVPTVGDIDDDGRDEVLGGNYLLDHDGSVLWEKMMANHNDSVAIVEWDGVSGNGREAVLSGWGQVVSSSGRPLVRLGPDVVPHGQEVRCGRFRTDLPGLQMAVRYDGHRERILYADRNGRVLARFEIDPTPINVGMEAVHWIADAEYDLLFSPPSFWDGRGQKVATLPGLPHPSGRARTAWFHCIPADLEGTGAESVVLFDPCTDEVFVYGEQPLRQDPPKGYRHTARQYNVRLMD